MVWVEFLSPVFSEMFVMPESICSIQRHFIGNSTNANGRYHNTQGDTGTDTKVVCSPAGFFGWCELKVCMSFEPHFISSPGHAVTFCFWPFFSSFCGPQGVKQCVRLSGKSGKRENYLHSQDSQLQDFSSCCRYYYCAIFRLKQF